MATETIDIAVPEIDPNLGYYEETGVPVFKPTLELFADFSKFITKIEKFGMEKGIVKVIPPKEWVDNLPILSKDQLKSIKIKNPIMQHVNGTFGLYKIQNVEKQRSYSLPEWRGLCEESEHQPPARRGERRKVNVEIVKKHKRRYKRKEGETEIPSTPAGNDSDEFQNFDYNLNPAEFTAQRCQELEKVYWKSLTYSTPMYGADMPGSLFDNSTTTWNVAHLDNILNQLKVQIPGVNTAYLYCGMWKATFAWHLEDMDLFSINYIHFGCPKQWYSISQADHEKFYDLMKDMWPQEYSNCKEFLRHKTFHASPTLLAQHGIKVNKIVHNQHEFMITFPYGYHSGYNLGYNVAESVNFATESWLPYGRESRKCECISDSVGINVDQLVRHMNGEYTEEEEVEDNSGSDSENHSLLAGLPTPPYVQFDEKVATKRKRKSEKKESEGTESPKRRKMGVVSKINNNNINNSSHTNTHRDPSTICLLCPTTDLPNHDFVKSPNNEYVHRICADYIPETDIIQSSTAHGKEVLVGLNDIPKARKSLRCLGCGSTRGACFQCSFPSCSRSYHATCSHSSGVLVMKEEEYVFLCKHHRPKRIEIERLESDQLTMDWAYSVLPGDIIQCQIANSDIFAGIVEENLLSEEIVAIRPLPECNELMEVEWKWVRHPFGGKEAIEVGLEKKRKAERLKEQKRMKELAVKEEKKPDVVQVQSPVETFQSPVRGIFRTPVQQSPALGVFRTQPQQSPVRPFQPFQPLLPSFQTFQTFLPKLQPFQTSLPPPPKVECQYKQYELPAVQPPPEQYEPPPQLISIQSPNRHPSRKRSIHNSLSQSVPYKQLTISRIQIGDEIIQFIPCGKGDIEVFLSEEKSTYTQTTPHGYQLYESNRVWIRQDLTCFEYLPIPMTNRDFCYYDFDNSRFSEARYVGKPPVFHV